MKTFTVQEGLREEIKELRNRLDYAESAIARNKNIDIMDKSNLKDVIKAFEIAIERKKDCGYIAMTLELRDKLVQLLKEIEGE